MPDFNHKRMARNISAQLRSAGVVTSTHSSDPMIPQPPTFADVQRNADSAYHSQFISSTADHTIAPMSEKGASTHQTQAIYKCVGGEG